MKKELIKQIKEAENKDIELEHHDIGEYRYEGEVILEVEDFDVIFNLTAVERGKTVDNSYNNPDEWLSEGLSIAIEDIRAYELESEKTYVITDEELIKSKLNIQ